MDALPTPGEPSRSLLEAIDSFRKGNVSHTPVSRLSDLSRAEVRTLTEDWLSIPVEHRERLVRRFDELSEERVDVNFRRALRVALEDPEPVIRQLAIAGLWEDVSTDLLERLQDFMHGDPSPDVRAEAARALERFSVLAVSGALDQSDANALRESLQRAVDGDETPHGVQRRALESLGPFGAEPEIASIISEVYESGDHGLQCSAVYAMGRSLQPRWLPMVLAELESDDSELRYEAVRAAAALEASDAIPALLEAARDDDAEIRYAAISAVGQIGGRGSVRALERLSEDAGDADRELIEAAMDDVNALLDPFPTS